MISSFPRKPFYCDKRRLIALTGARAFRVHAIVAEEQSALEVKRVRRGEIGDWRCFDELSKRVDRDKGLKNGRGAAIFDEFGRLLRVF